VSRCNHKNPLGFAFCVTCGEQVSSLRCLRCGFACDQRFIFCGGCGCELQVSQLSNDHAVKSSATPAFAQGRRYDLRAMMAQYELDANTLGSHAKVNQDDIRAMLEMMKKK